MSALLEPVPPCWLAGSLYDASRCAARDSTCVAWLFTHVLLSSAQAEQNAAASLIQCAYRRYRMDQNWATETQVRH